MTTAKPENNSPQRTAAPISWRIRQRRRPISTVISLNLTPMIDIVFLLLFFFLVVSRFRVLEGMLPAQLPAQTVAAADDIPQTPIRIRFLYDSALPDRCKVTIDRFNETPLPVGLLSGALAKIRDNPNGFDCSTPVHMLADDDVPWDHMVNAYNAALNAGYQQILFAGSK
ncbi:MAG: biopolymer transporter ExbD [Planctomycetota bacterium]|nr:MAG: biopolymer transporter ExbD [Planctomycetota bacterium]